MNTQNKTSSKIVNEVINFNILSDQVTEATTEQSKGIDNIIKAMDNVNSVIVQIRNAASEQSYGSK